MAALPGLTSAFPLATDTLCMPGLSSVVLPHKPPVNPYFTTGLYLSSFLSFCIMLWHFHDYHSGCLPAPNRHQTHAAHRRHPYSQYNLFHLRSLFLVTASTPGSSSPPTHNGSPRTVNSPWDMFLSSFSARTFLPAVALVQTSIISPLMAPWLVSLAPAFPKPSHPAKCCKNEVFKNKFQHLTSSLQPSSDSRNCPDSSAWDLSILTGRLQQLALPCLQMLLPTFYSPLRTKWHVWNQNGSMILALYFRVGQS